MVQCYAIWPDTGSKPSYLPEHFILGSNPSGGVGFRAAAVSPDRMPYGIRGEDVIISARWSAYGHLYSADSIYVDWFIPGSVFGAIGELYAQVHGDSLSGRAVTGGDVIPRVIPWLPVHGRSEPCPPGA
jgi:hypothetical protein